ncbi:MAG: DUF2169 domain-containing protein [Pseudomonadales bacterium]|nr:DUF2169 domain-containing protein [Pseudomonadales bacterium]
MLELVNETGAGAVLVPGWNLEGQHRQVLVARLTLSFDLQGRLWVADEQSPPLLTDQHYGKPLESSVAGASEIAGFKQGAEYYLHGSACTRTGQESQARVSVGLEQGGRHYYKELVALGGHQWEKALIGSRRGEPAAFASLPLRYENAYGGSVGQGGQREKHNPVGRGFNPSGWKVADTRAPQIEYPGRAALSPSQRMPVAGFGPLPVFWAPRRARFGTSPEDPLSGQVCPWGSDADPALHHCAPEDQWLARPFAGGELLTLMGFFADHSAPVELKLPRWQPQALLIRRGGPAECLATTCDTLVIDTEQRQLALIARTMVDPERLGVSPAWLQLRAASMLEEAC